MSEQGGEMSSRDAPDPGDIPSQALATIVIQFELKISSTGDAQPGSRLRLALG